jgi:hypothetical protein
MQTYYIVSDKFDSVRFSKKEDAEKYLKDMIFNAVCDFRFCVDILQSFRKHFSNIQLFEKKVEQLIEFATDENSDVKVLIKAWNEVFPDDQLAFIEKVSEA